MVSTNIQISQLLQTITPLRSNQFQDINLYIIMPNPFLRVAKIKISGAINQRMAENIFKRLVLASFLPIQGVVVHISSMSGSLTQAKNISDMLRNFSKEKHVPIYCFAQDECLGPANLILTTGHKCYANKMSVMGGFGFAWQTVNFHRWAQKYNMKQEQIYANSTQMRYKHLQQIKPSTAQFTQKQLEALSKDLMETMQANRVVQIKKTNVCLLLKQLSEQALMEQIFSKPAVVPEAMIKHGLIDGIKNGWQLCKEQFPGTKFFMINKHEVYDFMRYGFSNQQAHNTQYMDLFGQFKNDQIK